jgi:SET domain-containing protein
VSEPIDAPRHEALRLTDIPGKGRGVVAIEPIQSGALLEIAPVIPLTTESSPMPDQILYAYPFLWDDPPFIEAIALGLISMINHSDEPNAQFETDIPNKIIRLTASRDIAAGEEVSFDYGIPLWFDPS